MQTPDDRPPDDRRADGPAPPPPADGRAVGGPDGEDGAAVSADDDDVGDDADVEPWTVEFTAASDDDTGAEADDADQPDEPGPAEPPPERPDAPRRGATAADTDVDDPRGDRVERRGAGPTAHPAADTDVDDPRGDRVEHRGAGPTAHPAADTDVDDPRGDRVEHRGAGPTAHPAADTDADVEDDRDDDVAPWTAEVGDEPAVRPAGGMSGAATGQPDDGDHAPPARRVGVDGDAGTADTGTGDGGAGDGEAGGAGPGDTDTGADAGSHDAPEVWTADVGAHTPTDSDGPTGERTDGAATDAPDDGAQAGSAPRAAAVDDRTTGEDGPPPWTARGAEPAGVPSADHPPTGPDDGDTTGVDAPGGSDAEREATARDDDYVPAGARTTAWEGHGGAAEPDAPDRDRSTAEGDDRDVPVLERLASLPVIASLRERLRRRPEEPPDDRPAWHRSAEAPATAEPSDDAGDEDGPADDRDRDERAVLIPPGSTFERRPWWRRLVGALAVAVVTLFLLQFVRLLFPLVAWFLRDTQGVAVGGLVRIGLAPFVLALIAPLLNRMLGGRVALLMGTALLILIRLVEHTASDPGTDLWLAVAGITVALWLLSPLLSFTQDSFAHGMALGIALDTTIRGAAWTLDLSWAADGQGLFLLLGLSLVLVGGALVSVSQGDRLAAPRIGPSLPLAGLGPLLVLELMILQNQGWAATLTGWDWGSAFLLIGVGNVVGVLGTSLGRAMPGQGATGLIGGVLLLFVTVNAGLSGAIYAFLFLVAHLGAGMVLGALSAPMPPNRLWRSTLGPGLGFGLAGILLAVIPLAYYISYDVAVPISQELLIIATGVLTLLFGLGASVSRRMPTAPHWPVVLLVAALVLVPFRWWSGADEPDGARTRTGLPLRVATYNVHSGFSTDGIQDPEAIAQAIEATNADVVGLQEVSRGWLINGSTDLLEWLRRRLDMPYVAFHATTQDPLWGNAILSRAPLDDVTTADLPVLDTLLPRGVLAADVDLGNGLWFRLLVTHLHHTGDLERIHDEQVSALLESWGGERPAVLMGDFNAEPDTPQIQRLVDAGFFDVWQRAVPGFTANAADPTVRIDLILATEGLRTTRTDVVASTASDHRAVAVTLMPPLRPVPNEEPGAEDGAAPSPSPTATPTSTPATPATPPAATAAPARSQ